MPNLTRRDFVKTSATALAMVPAVGNERPYRACVIGHTGRGGYGHGLDVAFQKLPAVTVLAVADADDKGRADAQKRIGCPRAYADYREMLAKERPNLVAIGPRHVDQRMEMVGAAAEAGAHIYMEKPLAASLEEADALKAVLDARKLKLNLAHQMRVVPALIHLKKVVQDGLIGDLLEMRARGKEDRRSGGEDLMVLGWHCLYLMRYYAGDAAWCSARVTQDGRDVTPTDRRAATEPLGPVAGDTIHATYAFPGGVQGHFASQKARNGRSDFTLALFGSKGIVQIHIGGEPKVFHLDDPTWSPGQSGAAWKPLAGAPSTADPSGLSATDAHNKRLVEDLIRSVETGAPSVASMDEGRLVLEMVLSVYTSHLGGRRVTFPLADRKHPLG